MTRHGMVRCEHVTVISVARCEHVCKLFSASVVNGLRSDKSGRSPVGRTQGRRLAWRGERSALSGKELGKVFNRRLRGCLRCSSFILYIYYIYV